MSGLNLSQITNKQLNVQEQNAYDFAFVPPRNNVNMLLSNFSVGHYANLMDGMKNVTSTTQGGYIHFRFRGRRIGILVSKASANGILNFSVDGQDYGSYDTSYVDDYNQSATWYNIPVVIATDLVEGEHVLTITKPDAKTTAIQGFLVDNAGIAQIYQRTAMSYHEMLETGAPSWPTSLTTTLTNIRSIDSVLLCATFTNTTASVITVTLSSSSGTMMVFPVQANDMRQITGPIFFSGSLKASASATGVTMVLGVQ